MLLKRHLSTVTVAVALAFPISAMANGYQNLHQSAMGLGTAYAANGAGIDDVSAMFSNPASLSRFPGWNASAGVTLILPTDTFEGLSATTSGGVPITDGDPSEPSQFLDTTFSGFWYVSKQLSDKLHFGLAFNAPWATESDYTDTAASRYTATTTELTAYNLSPMLSYQVNEQLSVGAGLNIQYYTSKFATNISTTPAAPARGTDALATFEGDKLAFGATVGLEYQATDQWRFGVSYRSAINHEFDGDVQIDGSTAALAALPGFGISDSGTAKYDIATPWMLQLGAHGQINDRLEVYGSATLTGWSKFKDTIIETSNGLGTLEVKNGWHDAVYVAVGAGYQITPKTKIFGGLAYDETPTPTKVRNPRAPNAHRYYVGLGLSHAFSPSRSIKFGYAHTFFDDAPIRLTEATNPGRGSLNGDIKIDADIVMVQYVHSF
ncbi:OmpP1/FadL family transporter [Primorskyibacter flagellatus]|uniref:OmpP1/FadL family transporter n=1 Tax=Primorskyibacter flagellatus TaxID=1387277 RepID=UPI003A95932C